MRYNLEQRDRAAGWMSASDAAVQYAAPRSNSSDSPGSWPRGGLTRAGVTQGSVYREAYAVGLYETRWHPSDWKGVHGPRGPPDHAACAPPPPPTTTADALEDGLAGSLGEMEGRYGSLYEQQTNPFTQFSLQVPAVCTGSAYS